MKKPNLLITVAAIFLVFTAIANAGSSDDGVKKLRDEYHKKMVKAAAPANKEYEAKLQYGLKKALKFNHDDDAKAIREELAALKEDPAYLLNVVDLSEGVAQFAGTWKVEFDIGDGIYVTLIIDEDGRTRSKDSGWNNGRPWRLNLNTTVKYDEKLGSYKVTDGDTTIFLERVGKNRLKTGFCDQGDYNDLNAPASGTAKRIK